MMTLVQIRCDHLINIFNVIKVILRLQAIFFSCVWNSRLTTGAVFWGKGNSAGAVNFVAGGVDECLDILWGWKTSGFFKTPIL
jgi:hypothetical protein